LLESLQWILEKLLVKFYLLKKEKNMSTQLTSANSTTEQRQSKIATTLLWIIQVGLALIFLSTGSRKLIVPAGVVKHPMSVPLPGLFMQFIGVAEVAGALGLVLPGLFRIWRGLTPLAACGLVLIMIGATVVVFRSGNVANALLPFGVGLLCIVIAVGRRSWGFRSR
jgi:uncharacterized membrane protein YphA (DoxX/SURF4 family)